LESFLAQERSPGAAYDQAVLYVQGTHGHDLGIRLDMDKKRLELRSSLDRKEFNKVAELFEDQLDLKLIKDVQPTRQGRQLFRGASG
jgi:hypothetical protein